MASDEGMLPEEIAGVSIGVFVLIVVIIVAVLCATVWKEQCKSAWNKVSSLWSSKEEPDESLVE